MSSPFFIEMDELDVDGRLVPISAEQAKLLADSRLVIVQPAGDGQHRLIPNGRVGSARVGELQIDVKPKDKVGLTQLIFLLGYAKDPGFREDDVIGTPDADLWPALGYSLARLVERALSQGVLQGYRTTSEALRTVRGRIRFEDQIRARPGFMVPIEVTYDDFTVDIAENRILRAALRTMAGIPRLDDTVRRRLLHLDARLEGVSIATPGAPVPTWRASRLNERYQPALRLAEIVLRHAAAKSGPGGLQIASFVVVMWKVFEDFVTTALQEALRQVPGHTEAQLTAYLAGDGDWRSGSIPMSVDVVHRDRHRRPQVVFDAKYKVSSATGRYANADHYQMLAYCTALGVPRAWLIYAGGRQPRAPWRVKNTAVEIVQCPLDLSRHPRAILDQVAVIVQDAIGVPPSAVNDNPSRADRTGTRPGRSPASTPA